MLKVPTIAVPTNHATVVGIIEVRQYPDKARPTVTAAASSVVVASKMVTNGLVATLTAPTTITRRLGLTSPNPSARTIHASVAVSRVFRSGTVHMA
jgi:hypothetical protein